MKTSLGGNYAVTVVMLGMKVCLSHEWQMKFKEKKKERKKMNATTLSTGQ